MKTVLLSAGLGCFGMLTFVFVFKPVQELWAINTKADLCHDETSGSYITDYVEHL
jgi:hypothetical protein